MSDSILSTLADPRLQWCVVLGAALVAAVFDFRERRIPNALTGPLWLTGLACAALGTGAAGFGWALLASFLLALPYVILFVFAGGGAGDAKMMAGVGAWLGLASGGLALASVCFAGVLIALCWAWSRRSLPQVASSLQVMTAGLVAPFFGQSWKDSAALLPAVHDDQKMPYGLPPSLSSNQEKVP